MSCVSRHQRRGLVSAREDRGSGDGGDYVQGTCGGPFVKEAAAVNDRYSGNC